MPNSSPLQGTSSRMKCRPCGSNIIDQQHALGQVDVLNQEGRHGEPAPCSGALTDLSGARSPSEQ